MADNILDDDDDSNVDDIDSNVYYDQGSDAPLVGDTTFAPSSVLSNNVEGKAVGFISSLQPQDYNVSYIVEPINGGTLYLQVDGEPLQKLPFTMKNIVDRSLVTEDDMVYIGEKSTLMIALDPIAGHILRKFDLHDSQYELMMASKHKLPSHTIYLTRNEYKVRINDLKTNMSWRLTYSEYEPNAMNWDVPVGMEASDTYIAPDSNRVIAAINRTDAVTVFDMYRTPDFSLVLSKQTPPPQLNLGGIGTVISALNPTRQNSVYISVHGGTLYALSAEHFPLVQLAEWSFAETGKMPGGPLHLIDSGDSEFDKQSKYNTDRSIYRADKLIGRHKIDSVLLPPPSPPSPISFIDGPSSTTTEPSPSTTLHDYEQQHNVTNNHLQGFFNAGLGQYWQLYLILLLTAGFMGRKRGWELYVLHILPMVNHYIYNSNNQPERPEITLSAATTTTKVTTHDKDVSSNTDDLSPPLSHSSSTTINSTEKNDELQSHQQSSNNTVTSSLKATGLDLQEFRPTKSSVLDISEDVLGYGSHGTVVYKGTFDGRAVAVKRLLIDFYDVAIQEVKLLQESDDHPNVVRYFYKEESDRFLYIALELCFGSLQDCMDRSLAIPDMKLYDQVDPANTLYQITSGIQHLHSLKIVHRDLKPQNILLAPSKHGLINNNASSKDGHPPLRILISDFGLCKKLDGEQSSFHYTAASPAGTSGWRAPELLAGALAASTSASDHTTHFSNNSSSSGNGKDPNQISRVKATRSIDIFSAGCIFYYVLSNGDHPFGNRFGRESNILNGDYDISKLEDMGEDGMEAMDLIDSMINANPRSR
ncbi:kinase-like domain-containing protein [Chlamydoabsidia padenii]|nr:kinase-like domain-containing protein [Chlamydoabsidia padenii]